MQDFFFMYTARELTAKYWFLEFGDWLTLGLAFLSSLIVGRLFGMLGPRCVQKLSVVLKVDGQTKDLHLYKPFALVASSTVFLLFTLAMHTPTEARNIVQIAAKTLCSLSFVALLWRFTDVFSELVIRRAKQSLNSFDELSATFTRMGLKILTIVVGVVFLSESFDLPLKSIVAGLGIGSLAFALAAKDTIENLFGSLTVLMDRPFAVGDSVIIDKAEGIVERIGFRSTKIRTPQNSLISLPNSKLITAIVDNLGQRQFRRVLADVVIPFDIPLVRVEHYRSAVIQALMAIPNVKQDNLSFALSGLQATGLLLHLVAFLETQDAKEEGALKHQILSTLVQVAQDQKVPFALPTESPLSRYEDEGSI